VIPEGSLRSNHRLLNFIQILLDAGIVSLSLLMAYALYHGTLDNMPQYYTILMAAGAALFYIVAGNMQLYQSWRTDQLYRHLARLSKAWFITMVTLAMLGWGLKVSDYFSRVVISVWFVLTPLLLTLSRWCIRRILGFYRAQGRNVRYIAIVGNSKAGKSFIEEVQHNEWMGYIINGHYQQDGTNALPDAKLHGDFNQLVQDVKQRHFDEVFIALPMSEEDTIRQLVNDLSDSSTPVRIIPDLFTFNLMNARMSHIGNIPTISVFDSPHDDLSAVLKRSEDVILASLILLLISPLMVMIAIAIKLTSPGAVFFKQRRYGIGGNEITVWKFRSMTVAEDGDHVPQAQKNDSRITPLGAFLRRTSLDELPQFINVLQGQMSIVGPRPHAVAHNELYRKDIQGYMLRHLVKPGITGWAQINGWRGETDTLEKMEKRIEHDLEYIQNWSIFFDLKIIALTIFKGFINKNAY
jgi:putative colanic acid biosynthesis UDP-glucose lipid carrier transferase